MRLRFAMPASLTGLLISAVIPAATVAAPHHNHGLTINATPNPIVTGDPVLVYGQLNLPTRSGQIISLYHRVNPAGGFTLVQTTTTNALGFYEFTRADGVVTTNRSWFVRGPSATHSRTVHERVAAALTLSTSNPTTGETNHPLTFTGSIAPGGHAGERVFLQQLQAGGADNWHTIATGRILPGSTFAITHRFRQPGVRDLRVTFRGDVRNVRASSDSFTASIEQTQNPAFTITSSAPTIDAGQPVTVSGVLHAPGSSTAPLAATSVTLWGRTATSAFAPIGSTLTGADGSYSFTQTPLHNTVYRVRTTFAPPKHRVSAQLFEGVRDVVTIAPSATSSLVGQAVTFQGTVTPDKAGHVIYLEKLDADGDFHVVKVGRVTASSAYTFSWTFGSPGTKTFRVRIPGGDSNAGGHSPAVSIAVGLPPVQSLPPAT